MKNITKSRLELLCTAFMLIGVSCLVMGIDACREDYYFASQATPITPTPEATPTDNGDDDDDVVTPTPTPTSTSIFDDAEDDDDLPDLPDLPAVPTPTPLPEAQSARTGGLLDSLGKLGEAEQDGPQQQSGEQVEIEEKSFNWLGQDFQKKQQEEAGEMDESIPPPPPGAVPQ